MRTQTWYSMLLTGLMAVSVLTEGAEPAQAKSKRSKKAATVEVSDSERTTAARTSSEDKSESPSDAGNEARSTTSSERSATSGESASAATAPSDKVGRFIANFKIGPAIGAHNAGHHGAIVLEAGWSVLPNKNAYLLLPLQFQFAEGGGAVILPVGFQYDIGISKVPGLYLYPRFSVGYAAFFASAFGQTTTTHFGVILPEFGAKYVYKGRFNFGGEIFSLPIYFAEGGAALQYRILLSAGLNF